jgi:hypothetical protein
MAVAALALTGCAPSPSVANIVDGKTTTITQFWDVVDACANATGLSPDAIWRDINNHMLRASVAAVIMDERGISFPEAELASIIEAGVGSHVLADPTCKAVFLGSASWSLLQVRLGTDEFDAAVWDVDVVLNPRYGYWDPTSGSAVGSGSLSTSLAGR